MAYFGKFVCVGLNPCFDVTLSLRQLDEDKVNRVADETRHAAGVALNVAAALHRLRLPCCVAGIAGQDNLQAYISELSAMGIPAHFIKTEGAIRENLTLLYQGKTVKINRPGPECTPVALSEFRGYLNRIAAPGDTVVFGGRCAQGMTPESYASVIELAANLGMRVVIDTDVLVADHLFKIRPWLIKPNRHELEMICSRELRTEDELLSACNELVAGGVETVLLTMGGDGLMAVRRGEHVRVKANSIKVKNTVGAGDNALAGFLCADADGASLYGCAQFAAQLAESALTGEYKPKFDKR